MPFAPVFETIRPLVRYVDAERAVVETVIRTRQPLVSDAPPDAEVDVVLSVSSDDGFEDEMIRRVKTENGAVRVQFEMVWPHRWWPASMGAQAFYTLNVDIRVEGVSLDQRSHVLGLTSVRLDRDDSKVLVNGEPFELQEVVAIDRCSENQILPAGANTILMVRDHFAGDDLLEATDRAGILTIQCVPLDAEPDTSRRLGRVVDHVRRLSNHPSLMGWYVGHLGPAADRMAKAIRKVDPTRVVYRDLPTV